VRARSSASGNGLGVYQLERPIIHDAIDGFWTAVCAMTTVGYGRKYPRTSLGQMVVIVATLFGMMYLTMPLTIIQWRFQVEMGRRDERRQKEAGAKAERDVHKKISGKMTISLILKAKKWARRARLRLRGHAAHHSDDVTKKKAVENYARALHALANAHDYVDVQAFKAVHEQVVEHVVAKCRAACVRQTWVAGAVEVMVCSILIFNLEFRYFFTG
jgi:hypothetical protein